MLNSVVEQHPLMQGVIVKEVRDLLLRPNLAARAQYYCICFLSSQMLSSERLVWLRRNLTDYFHQH